MSLTHVRCLYQRLVNTTSIIIITQVHHAFTSLVGFEQFVLCLTPSVQRHLVHAFVLSYVYVYNVLLAESSKAATNRSSLACVECSSLGRQWSSQV